jgi:hypothetical protein
MPLAALWLEAEFVKERINGLLGSQAILTHAAIVDAIAGGEHLKNAIAEMEDG